MSLFSAVSSSESLLRPSFFRKAKEALRRFFNVFFYGLGIIMFLSICLKVWGAFQMHAAMAVADGTVLRLDLDTNLYETRPDDFIGALTFGEAPTVADVVTGLRRAAEDSKITMLAATLTRSNLSLAQVQEIRSALSAFRKSGKKTIVYAPTLGELGGGLNAYYLATAFDEIWVQPTGEVGVSGMGFEMPYIRKALEKLGIRPSFSARYEYKTGADMMTASHMSEAERKNLTSLIDSLLTRIAADVADARGLSEKEARRLLISGPYDASRAKSLKLIDEVEYADVLEERLKEEGADIRDFFDYAAVSAPFISEKTPVVAYIPAVGVIQFGDSVFGGDSYASIMGTGTVGAQLRDAAEDDTVKAVVLRIDSPGGGYTPSDSLWRDLIYLRRDKKKPVVCTMSSTAASGGYFVSLGCDRVFAQPATLTGSIGVFGGKLVFRDLLKKLDIHVDSVSVGKNAGLLSMAQDFTPSQKKYFNDTLDRIYKDFTAKVAERRGLTARKTDAVARGRVFTGEEAVKNGLVDAIGGIEEAVAAASEMAGAKKPLPLLEYPVAPTRLEMLMQFIQSGSIQLKSGRDGIKGYLPALKSWAERLGSGDMRLFYPGAVL